MAFFPQINDNMILTQLPYSAGAAYLTAAQDLESGPKWSFPFRAAGLSGYPAVPLGRFAMNFPNITDAEVTALANFFNNVARAKWLRFSLLDPGGNLLQYSEDFTNSYWNKVGTVVTAGAIDPFGHTLGCQLTAGTAEAVVGPSAGGMSGFVMCSSVWLYAENPGTQATLGFLDNTTSTFYSVTYNLPANSWVRIYKNLVLPTNNQFLFKLTMTNTCIAFGAMVAATKGEGPYVRTPGNYGYHANVRFDTDSISQQQSGPNQNSVLLTIVEVNA